jgi:hypothetical protein
MMDVAQSTCRFDIKCGPKSTILTVATLLYLALAAACCGVKAEERQATQWFVTEEKIQVYSGPGEDFYPTSFAALGDALEVHRETDDGWMAIRPPEGSFSWVRADDAYLLPGGKVIEITSESAVSWIGSELGSAKHYRWQVSLQPGEQLAVIGEASTTDSKGNPSLWYKIAPPSGEFRWIHNQGVSEDPPPLDELQNRPKRVTGAAKPLQDAATETVSILDPNADIESGNTADEASVELAGYQDDVFDDAPVTDPNGVVIEPIPQAAVVANGYHGPYREDPNSPGGRFAGWSAFDFTDDGLHFNLLRRSMANLGPPTDPLQHDPFSLEMPQRAKLNQTGSYSSFATTGPVAHGPYFSPDMQPHAAERMRGYRPWRDPRELRERRLHGYPGLSRDDTAPNNLVDSIRANMGGLRDSIQGLRQDLNNRTSSLPNRTDDGRYSGFDDRGLDTATQTADSRHAGGEVDWYGVKRDHVSAGFASTPTTSMNDLPANDSVALNDLQVAVSEMVTRPPGTWNLGPLAERTQHLIEHGSNPVERGQARLLLDRIRQFQEHERRSAFVPGGIVQAGYEPTHSPPSNPSTSPFKTASFQQPNSSMSGYSLNTEEPSTSMSGSDLAGKQPFDATGWLVPVHSSKHGQPTHALTNENGAVIAYVTGLPGMNLNLYVNQAVGVTGLRGYLPQLKAGHIQAERVVRIQ